MIHRSVHLQILSEAPPLYLSCKRPWLSVSVIM
jgi:hypothetical protein